MSPEEQEEKAFELLENCDEVLKKMREGSQRLRKKLYRAGMISAAREMKKNTSKIASVQMDLARARSLFAEVIAEGRNGGSNTVWLP